MKKSVAINWINALRSGKYRQGKGFLCRKGKYCCLGVLNELYPELDLAGDHCKVLLNYKRIGLFGGHGWLEDAYGESLAGLNDTGYTFDEIADIIQIEYVEGL